MTHPQHDPDSELSVFARTINAFVNYPEFATADVVLPRRTALELLPESERKIADEILEPSLSVIAQRIVDNSTFAARVAQMGFSYLQDSTIELELDEFRPNVLDEDKVYSTFRQIVREWSAIGRPERDAAFGPVLRALENHFPTVSERNNIRVVCPGSGLGRLPFEIARLGFDSVGNEFSTHMLFASAHILNNVTEAESQIIYPFIHTFSGNMSTEDQTEAVRFPDVSPVIASETTRINGGQFSMAVGDFQESFTAPASIDVVVAMFFLDTSPNLVSLVRHITDSVRPGGLLISFGPLLWHFEAGYQPSSPGKKNRGSDGGPGLDFTFEQVLQLFVMFGWVITSRDTVKTTYASNPRNMSKYVYDCEFFVARKPE